MFITIEINFPCYWFCGPGIELKEGLAQGECGWTFMYFSLSESNNIEDISTQISNLFDMDSIEIYSGL